MDSFEQIESTLQNSNILVDFFPLDKLTAFTIKIDKKDYICVNKNIKLSKIEKRIILEHEYSHILTNSFYSARSAKQTIARNERKANDNLLERLNLVDPIIEQIKKGYPVHEVAENLDITESVVYHCLDYVKRKEVKI